MKKTTLAIALALALTALNTFAQVSSPPSPDGQDKSPREAQRRGPDGYSIEQATSDNAQLHTIAFDALGFLTGDLGSCTFLPPGKVSDYFGFQYMRDIDTGTGGHNTSFLTTIANNMLHVLTPEQKAQLIALGKEQSPQIRDLAYKRFPLIKAFWRQRDGDTPQSGTGLNREAIMKYSADMWELDGSLAFQRAKVCGAILRSLDEKQKAYLATLKFGDSKTWPVLDDQIDKRSLPHEVDVAVMTYTSEMFSWYSGSVEADVYFCPERHGTYFGSFYMKDAPVMGKQNASISTSLTGDSGREFLDTLTASQREQITSLVDLQRHDLEEIIKTRRAIAVQLRRFLVDDSANKETVQALSRRYGELDGEISYLYATHFAAVNATLTAEQKTALMKLRNLEGYTSKGAFVYSDPISMPEIENTDFLFGVKP